MNKPVLYTGIGMIGLEMFGLAIFLLSQITLSKELIGLLVFGGYYNLIGVILLLIGALSTNN